MASVGDNAKEQLRSFVERLENLEDEIKERNSDKADLFKEAKGQGFDVKAMKTVLRLRKQDPDERKEQDAIVDTYLLALGMI